MAVNPKEFWSSKNAANYPRYLIVNREKIRIGFYAEVITGIGKWLGEQNFISDEGLLLDLASGETSGELFGIYRTPEAFSQRHERIRAVDINPFLIKQNILPEIQKTVLDLGIDKLPGEWSGQTSLATFICAARYLTDQEDYFLAQQVYRILKPGGRYIVIDFEKTAFDQIGEVRRFDVKQELITLEHLNFKDLKTFDFWVPFSFDGWDDNEHAHLYAVTGIK